MDKILLYDKLVNRLSNRLLNNQKIKYWSFPKGEDNMNVNDFPDQFSEKDLPNFFRLVYNKQHELAERYTPIEVANNARWSSDIPVDLNTTHGQLQCKDMAWRCIEEIGESLEAWFEESTPETELHSKEEKGLKQQCENLLMEFLGMHLLQIGRAHV